ncbi:MAG: O-antigen ligase family protein [Planctomycetaceae bacterium]
MSQHPSSVTPTGRLERTLLSVVDVIIAALIFVLPFIMGGREAWGHWFVISAALLLGTAWAVYATVHGSRYVLSWMELFFVAGLAIVCLQIQPQSPEITRAFSGEYERLLPAWADLQVSSEAESWATLSLTPVETRHGMLMFIAYIVIMTVLFQRIRDVRDCVKLLKCVAISGVAMTLFGLVQWGTSNGRFFWFYQHPYTNPTDHLKGAFTNRNHFAQFLSLSLGPLLWWLFRDVKKMMEGDAGHSPAAVTAPASRRRSRHRKSSRSQGSGHGTGTTSKRGFNLSPQDADRFLSVPVIGLVFCISIVGLAVLMSLSRGGMIAAGAAVMVALVGLWRGFNLGGAMAGIVLGGGVVFLSMLAFTDQEMVQSKVDDLISVDVDEVDAGGPRRAIWTADAQAIQRFPWLGTGVGSHRDVYATYMENYADFAGSEMTHAESSYIHLALETGLVGVGCLILALLFYVVRMLTGYLRCRLDSARSIAIAVAASSAAALLHAVTDFIWYVPGIVVVSLVLAVVGLKSVSRNFGTELASQGIWFPRIVWGIVGGCCLLGLIQVQPQLQARIIAERHLNNSLLTELEIDHGNSDGFADLQAGDSILFDDRPVKLSDEAQAAQDAEKLERTQQAQIRFHQTRISHLARSLQARPDQHRVQVDLAEQLLALFDLLQLRSDSPMPLKMLRDAAVASEFASDTELRDWMQRACGKPVSMVVLADRLARESLASCPVQGYAYLSLVETSFLRDPDNRLHQPLIDQAMLVRGHDPRVRFVAGREALMAGQKDDAFALWDSVFHANQYFRLNILQLLAPEVAAEFFIHQFQPDAEELKDVLAVYQILKRPRDCDVVMSRLCEVIPLEAPSIEDEDERLKEMLFAGNAAREIKNLPLAADLLQQTVNDFPSDYDAHYALGVTLFELERHEEAIQHLTWCHDWDSSNEWVPKMIGWSRHQILRSESDPEKQVTQLWDHRAENR